MRLNIKNFNDLIVLKSRNFNDKRGYSRELIKEKDIKKKFVFTFISKSKKNVLRGLHFQSKHSQAKIITVTSGKIMDVAVDLRKRSPTFGKYFSIIMSYDSDFSFFIPENFAHGFLCLSKTCTVNYKCSNYRDPKYERTLIWNDPSVKIKWPLKKPILSTKDKYNGLKLSEI